MNKRVFSVTVVIKGFCGIVAQTLLLRYLLVLFGGNELTLSLMLGTWLIGGAIGSSFFARAFSRDPKSIKPYGTLLFVSGLTLPLTIILLSFSKPILGVAYGELLTLGQIALVCFLGLFLPALCDGALFALGLRLLPTVGRIYLLESCGIIAGGIVFTLVLLSLANPFQIALAVTILNLACRALLVGTQDTRPWHRQTAWTLTVACVLFFLLTPKINAWLLEIQWPKKQIVADAGSFYGHTTIAKEKNQHTIFYDGLPLLSIPDPEMFATEDFIHIPMLAKPETRSVLWIGTAAGGLLKELLKYPVAQVTIAEIDPLLIKMLLGLQDPLITRELKDPRVRLQLTDGRRFARTTRKPFDAIFINAGPPLSLSANRYYTREFFRDLEKNLGKTGMAVFKTPGSLSYLSPEMKKINASLIKTLKEAFPGLTIIPGDGFNLIIASRQNLAFDPYRMERTHESLKIQSSLINAAYLKLRLNKEAQDWFDATLRSSLKKAQINSDLKPTAVYEGLSLHYAQFSKKIPRLFSGLQKIKLRPLVVALVLFFLYWRRRRRDRRADPATLNAALLTTGLYAMSTQIILLLLFQSFWGSLFGWLALLTTSFMVGAAAGAGIADHKKTTWANTEVLWKSEALLTGLVTVFLLTVVGLFEKTHNTPALSLICFLGASATTGLLAGLELPLIFEIRRTKEGFLPEELPFMAGRLYGWDLLGACLGSILAPLLLIPGYGVVPAVLLVFFIKIANSWCLAGLKK